MKFMSLILGLLTSHLMMNWFQISILLARFHFSVQDSSSEDVV
jgi:hypothetical protein